MTEALCATCLLLKMASADIGAEKKLDNLWNIVLDMDKQLFVSEKFLTVASEDGMYSVMHSCIATSNILNTNTLRMCMEIQKS